MDSGSLTSEHEADSGVGSMNSFEPPVCIRITVPDLGIQKSLQFNPEESVWTAKQQILLSVAKGLKEGFNYGLFIPPTNGKAGKFLDDGRLLKEYSLTNAFISLELIMKRRIYRHVMATEKKLKQLHSRSGLKQVMEWVRKGDVDKVIKVTNQGLDPNFIDPDSGETPLSLSVSLERPTRMILSVVGGGAHLDFRNRRGLTPLHIAAIQGKEEAIKGLLDLGASGNYYDLQGLTPAYHCVCNNSTPKSLEMLLYDHAILGAMDESNWTELHQACKWGRVQHLELMIYYGASLNAQNSGGSTPLHICAVNNQEDCARVLLFRGADKTIKNFANHDASETAVISGNTVLAQIIRDFSNEDVVSYQDVPRYNEKRRARLQTGTLNMAPMQRWQSNPQLHLLFHDDQLSSLRSTNARNKYDLTLPQNMSLGGKPVRRQSDIPLASEAFGIRLNQPHIHENGTQKNGPKSSISGIPLPRMVFLRPGKNGYGFILRGSRGSADDSNYVPTPEVPALQYFSIIAENSVAEHAGIKPRDFLLEVNGQNVRKASHDFTVNLIKQTRENLCLLVVSPAEELNTPVVSALNSIETPRRGMLYDPTFDSQVAAPFSKPIGGLADLENLERIIDEDDCSEIDCGTSLRRLFIAPNVQTLERMARVVGAGENVASVHTRHGKQMAKSMPFGETYQDSMGLCRSRIIASLPNEDSRAGNLWRASSMQNLVSRELTILEDQKVATIQKPRMFIPREQPPSYTRMFSFPGPESENGKHIQGVMDNKNFNQEKNPVLKRINTTDGTSTPRPLNLPPPLPTAPPPPLPVKNGRLKLVSSGDSVTETKAAAESVGVTALHVNKVSRNISLSSIPPPLPPLRPVSQNGAVPPKTPPPPPPPHLVRPVSDSSGTLPSDRSVVQIHHSSVAPSLSYSSAQSANKVPHFGAGGGTLPPTLPPPPPPVVGSLPPFSVTCSSCTSQQSTLKEDFSGCKPMAAQNSLLEEIRKKRELLAPNDSGRPSWEVEEGKGSNSVCGQQSPGQTSAVPSTPSTAASLLSEIQMRRKQLELKAAAGNHVQEAAENQMDRSETSSSNSQQPFLQDLVKALSNKTRHSNEIAAVPNIDSNRAPVLHAADKLKAENIPVQLVKVQPANNHYQHSPPVFPPQRIPPPGRPKFNSTVPPKIVESVPKVGKPWMSHQQSKSIESLDLDLPPPPPPPPPSFDDVGLTDLDDSFLPLPPPPEEFDLPSNNSFLQGLKPSSVPLADCNTHQYTSSSSVENRMVGTNGKDEVSYQPLDAWSVDDVAIWLRSIELEEHVNAFLENSVDGAKLSQLNFIDWIQLGISDLDQRMKIVQARQKLVT